MTSRREIAANYVILTLFAVVALWPIATILIGAFGAATGVDSGGLHLGNFEAAWNDGHFGRYLVNSLSVSALVIVISVPASLMAGYAFGTMQFPASQVLFYLFLLGIMVPAEAIVIPLFFDLRTLGLTDTYLAIALPQVAQSIAFGTFWLRAQFRSMPTSLLEAAALDGAGPLRALRSILVPASRPAIVTLVVLVFMWTWNEFLIALIMTPSGSRRTAPLGLATFQGQYTSETALLAAAAVIIALPTVILFLFLQRHFIRGMLEGVAK